jgi:hypothetical protein
MCKVKIIINNDKVHALVKKYNLEGEIQVNIGKLKHDKRNNMISTGDIVQIEFTFDMNRQNGAKYGNILCRYDNIELKNFKRNGLLAFDEDEFDDLPSSVSDNSSKEDPETINIDELDLNDL